MFSRWWCDIGSEPYGVMSLEGESSKEEVDFFCVCGDRTIFHTMCGALITGIERNIRVAKVRMVI